MEEIHEKYMKEALKEAQKAYDKDEVPVGAIIVKNNEIIARGHNLREKNQMSIDHAEIVAIRKASKKLKSWRLDDCDMYVTLEPCLMCAGAILQSRIKNVYYGTTDSKAGVIESIAKIPEISFCHKVTYVGGIKKDESKKMIQEFFSNLRKRKKTES